MAAEIIYTEMPKGSTNYKTCLEAHQECLIQYLPIQINVSLPAIKVLTFSTGKKKFFFVDREKKLALLCYVCYVSRPDVIILQTYWSSQNLCSVNFQCKSKRTFLGENRIFTKWC